MPIITQDPPAHITFYNAVGACPVLGAQCGVLRDAATNVPRGYFTLAKPGDPIDLMFVAQNPGQPKGPEHGLYTTLADVAQTHLAFTHALFIEGQGSPFHKTVNAWVETITGLGPKQAWARSVYTNLVKCTTVKNALPCRQALSTCARKWFRDELSLWRPAIVVGMGAFASRSLASLGIPSLPMLHPSHREGEVVERQHLKTLIAKLASERAR